ncbi:DNA/RNA helicase domain-containing protein [Sphingobacterium arenae]|uniref:DUF2075 domain-containing protein n=1 Tax=Sphingobacterium arenae TaxID=1280598 RepID=A0ABR7Y321_9SPHI|nr:DNA/RNA helicase domain-containing protein [Sphingobacterium arenae]MBD1425704.1 DUF2075 domain-containing protein [Sphingobacterium arenae]
MNIPTVSDVPPMDESHRIREKTGYPFKPTGRLQVEELLWAARISVFFIDDYQVVRRGEIGSSSFIRAQAEKMGCTVYEYDLESQFRNGGSEKYSQWGFPENSHDGQVKGSEVFVQLVKNTYRVLLGRGMKACYVYFMDKETERYFRSRVRR